MHSTDQVHKFYRPSVQSPAARGPVRAAELVRLDRLLAGQPPLFVDPEREVDVFHAVYDARARVRDAARD